VKEVGGGVDPTVEEERAEGVRGLDSTGVEERGAGVVEEE
jgi:hypothetical protein